MSYIASNNGLTITWQLAGYVLQAGEVDMGDTYPTAAQLAVDFPNLALTQAQTVQLALLTVDYWDAIQVAVSYTSQGGVTKTFQADLSSQVTLSKELVIYTPLGATPTGYYWVAADNTQVPFTLADLQGLSQAMGAQGLTAFQHLQTLKGQVRTATSVSQVQAIVW